MAQFSDYDVEHRPASHRDSIPTTLPAVAYRPSSQFHPVQPAVPTINTGDHASNASARDTSDLAKTASPDPHDFYRQYTEAFRREPGGVYGLENTRLNENDNMPVSTVSQRAHNLATGAHSPAPLSTRSSKRTEGRQAPSTLPTRVPVGAKLAPQGLQPPRGRQTSLQALVNKFNQTLDEVPPLPASTPGSRSTSASRNPAAKHGRRPISSETTHSLRSNVIPRASVLATDGVDTGTAQPGKARHNIEPAPTLVARVPASRLAKRKSLEISSRILSNSSAIRSVTDTSPKSPLSSRQPLFGEVLIGNPGVLATGYGIPPARQRRGSDGNMRRPNAMFRDDMTHTPLHVSPSSPTAWYMGVTPSLEGIDLSKPIPPRPHDMHRRSRSDLTGLTPQRSPRKKGSNVPHLYEQASPPEPASPITTKHHPQSRIPIRSRRPSTASDSDISPPRQVNHASLRALASSPARQAQGVHPTRRPFVDLQTPASPQRSSRPNTPRRSPRHRNPSPPRQPSPRLQAIINDSAPAKSPPLRSSRPRQSIYSASTTASRAHTVESSSLPVPSHSVKPRDKTSRALPELSGIDFALRRQRIQQAFTDTVKENEIEAERGRRSVTADAGPPERGTATGILLASAPEAEAKNLRETGSNVLSLPRGGSATKEDFPTRKRDLLVDTNSLLDDSASDIGQDDSPTLGATDSYFPSDQGKYEDPSTPSTERSGATSGTAETFFDNEPQDVSVSSHTRATEEPGLRASEADFNGTQLKPDRYEGSPDRDDQESIRIMLGEVAISDTVPAAIDSSGQEQDGQPHGLRSRWSVSSWNSSTFEPKERLFVDRENDSALRSHPQPYNSRHLSMATTDSSYYQQHPWSPESATSLVSGLSTVDGDSYNKISHVLDSYHDANVADPKSLGAIKRLFAQSPNLARAGGWDARKVTQLYLEDLARSKNGNSSALPSRGAAERDGNRHDEVVESLKHPTDNDGIVQPDHTAAYKKKVEAASVHGEKTFGNAAHETSNAEYPVVLETLQPVHYDNLHRASLNNPHDWAETSPSMIDWIQRQTLDTPVDEKSTSPFRDDSAGRNHLHASSDSRPRPHEAQSTEGGLGIIDIHADNRFKQTSAASSRTDILDDMHSTPRASPLQRTGSKSSPRRATSPTPRLLTKYAETATANGTCQPSATRTRTETATQVADRASTRLPSISSDTTGRSDPPPEEQKRLTRRKNIIKELVDTESSFGQDMTVVVDIYKETSHVILNSSDDVKVLFGNAAEIVAFSTTFLDALKRASKSVYVLPKSKRWKSKRNSDATTASTINDDHSSISGIELTEDERDRLTTIGQAFEQNLTQMERVYTEYLKNHESASLKLQALQKSDKVQIWLKECRAYAHDLTTAWDLDSLLVKPVQRLLKYPLLLKELVEVTPENHPDFILLDNIAREMVGVSVRINDAKKRADLVEQVNSSTPRKRKDYEGRLGLSKAFGRRSEKFRQQVGLSDIVQDRDYNMLADKFGSHFFQVQVVMRDVEMYTVDVQAFVSKFNEIILAVEAYTDVAQTSYPEVESKWRMFRLSVREIQMTALTDHVNAVRKTAVEPMMTLLKLYEGPQKLMEKRKKRVIDYARFKALKERGEKIDKKTTEQGEQFIAVNETLKDELPKLFSCTKRLVEACLNNFVQLQLQWQIIWRRKLSQAIDNRNLPSQVSEIVDAFSGDFRYTEAQVLSLGICNGSFLSEASAGPFLSSASTLNGDASSSRRPSMSADEPRNRSFSIAASDTTRNRGISVNSHVSPMLPRPDLGRPSESLASYINDATLGTQAYGSGRLRTGSNASGRSYEYPATNGYRNHVASGALPVHGQPPRRPSTGSGRGYDNTRASLDNFNRYNMDAHASARPISTSAYRISERPDSESAASLSQRCSAVFSSAMPMSDTPLEHSPTEETPNRTAFNVLFLAASVYEFNIDRARREAGYPYLTYVAGEIFDVIGEKGELWLAKNQDDRTNTLGWIWNKHFAKLAS